MHVLEGLSAVQSTIKGEDPKGFPFLSFVLVKAAPFGLLHFSHIPLRAYLSAWLVGRRALVEGLSLFVLRTREGRAFRLASLLSHTSARYAFCGAGGATCFFVRFSLYVLRTREGRAFRLASLLSHTSARQK